MKSKNIVFQIIDLFSQDLTFENLYNVNEDKEHNSFLKNTLGWSPNNSFDSGLQTTVKWYLRNLDWCKTKFQNI